MWSLSKALDLALIDEEIEKGLNVQLGKRHGERVAYISLCTGKALNLARNDIILLTISGLLHDIGAVGGFHLVHASGQLMKEHCVLGAELVKGFPRGDELAAILLAHHETPSPKLSPLKMSGEAIPLFSKIISLADHVDIFMASSEERYANRDLVRDWVTRNTDFIFFPEVAEVFLEMSYKEAFWLDLEQHNLMDIALELLFGYQNRQCEVNDMDEEDVAFTRVLAEKFAMLIDQKSRFTARHSRGVANNVVTIARRLGWPQKDLDDLYLAGLLHDLGKLAVPRKILDKPGALDKNEFALIRTHTYYTSRLLSEAGFPPHVVEWAAHHHERLDGKGYPFCLKAERLDVGARIMAIADIFTALTENRPYREGLPLDKAFAIMEQSAGTAIDGELLLEAKQALKETA